MTTTGPDAFRALYYPFSRTISEATLKRAVLLYDEILFVDPMSPRVRAGLYKAEEHLPYLPANVATSMEQEWTGISGRYELLQREGVLRLVDPADVVTDPVHGWLIADALRADLRDPRARDLFRNGFPTTWSMLRTRIPQQAFAHLTHQIPARVLGTSNVSGQVAFYLDGHPRARPMHAPGTVLPDDGRDYAALVPYVAGSSLATSTALALAMAQDAVPLTDSAPHFRLLSLRMKRAAAAASEVDQIPGLHAEPDPARAQKTALVHQRVVDAELSHQDLAAMSLEDCLRYRERTHEARQAFRDFLHDVVLTTYAEPWSPEIVPQIEERIAAARQEVRDHARPLREVYRSLFHRTLAGLAVTAAPALLTTVFPVVSPLTVLLFGGGPLTAVVQEPVRELLTHWLKRDQGTSSLAYLMDLPK
ncbi:hypothetical protein [Streptomyces sp. T028]|uniref:hypothetical protein n=1 Tax=Streptomyces sp. T028 TaxID=3394379 RepID=UPI003A839CBE